VRFPLHTVSAVAARRNRLVGTSGARLLAVFNTWLLTRRVGPELEPLDERSLAELRISRCDFDRIASATPERQERASRRPI
jgi:uncharacterized protein YjiS (DUF1127 family)